MMTAKLAEVIVDVRTKALDRPFHYLVPIGMAADLQRGHRVVVPFGRQQCQGYVVNLVDELPTPGVQLKPLLSVLDAEPALTEEMLDLTEWLCHRYACTRLEAVQAVLPSSFREAKVVDSTKVVFLEMAASVEQVSEAVQTRKRRAPKQAQILQTLLEEASVALSESGLRPSDPAVQAIVDAGLACLTPRDAFRQPTAAALREPPTAFELNAAQEMALRAITEGLRERADREYVLHGVTGSGKTEVYIQAIDRCLQADSGAIVLVPEIALTPQMVGRFTTRFGGAVAVLHSGLSGAEKRDEWLRVRRGEAQIVVGARSAVFAPVRNLRLVIIDEEHENSYKQEESPRYDAREVAAWRANALGGVVVYGSATPSLQTMHLVETKQAKLLSLPFRVNRRPLPPVTIVDMRDELRAGNRSLFSSSLADGLERTVASGKQAILFLNRRGYAAFALCRNCGETIQCPRCDISLTIHKGRGGQLRLVCHYCQYTEDFVDRCPQCGEHAIRQYGVGTQQVEQALRDRWPNWRVLRMDVDTTRKRGAHQSVIQRFYDGEADVLLGTQMIAKGLDFPNVTFVGVIAADTMLSVPDYRSAERTFSLLTQVAGRAGRAEAAGQTVIQTYRPEHYAITSAATHDYGTFYRQERLLRETFHYPPFCEIAVFVAVHEEERLAKGAAARFERELRRAVNQPDVTVLPASPAPIARVEDQHRFQVVVKYSHWEAVRQAIVEAYQLVSEKMRSLRGHCILDVNAGRI